VNAVAYLGQLLQIRHRKEADAKEGDLAHPEEPVETFERLVQQLESAPCSR